MQINRSVEIAHPLDTVWQALCDVRLVADCLPGASISEDLGDDRYKGRLQVKVGPLAASFDGDVAVERQALEHAGKVSGKGADARSASRASGALSYRLQPGAGGTTRIEVVAEVNLAGALAQFGKLAVMQEIASRITDAFVANLDARLAATAQPAAPRPAAPQPAAAQTTALNAGSLIWSVLWARFTEFLQRLFGRRPVER